jgi:hypothetical protein
LRENRTKPDTIIKNRAATLLGGGILAHVAEIPYAAAGFSAAAAMHS